MGRNRFRVIGRHRVHNVGQEANNARYTDFGYAVSLGMRRGPATGT